MNVKRITIARSKNGIEVWYNPATSHAATHIKDTPYLDKLAANIIRRTDLTQPHIQFHEHMRNTVGVSDLVKNDLGDEIVYAKRLNRDEYTVFNKTKKPQPSPLVTIAVEKQADNTYELVSAWIGPSDSPSFPGTERETQDSKSFWSEHSLAWGNQVVQPKSVTKICPW